MIDGVWLSPSGMHMAGSVEKHAGICDRRLTPLLGSSCPEPKSLRLKLALLSFGAKVTDQALRALESRFKLPQRVRSGASGGLDAVLPDNVWVNIPLNEQFVKVSPLLLDFQQGEFIVGDARDPNWVTIKVLPRPAYSAQFTSDGMAMTQVGQMSGDRLGLGLTTRCFFWERPSLRCKFCSIGLNARNEAPRKTVKQILETVEAAVTDPVLPARHLLLSGGTPEGVDHGALAVAEVTREIKKRFSVPIYAMVAPPFDSLYIDTMREAGVDELGMNLELFSEEAACRFMPGKHTIIGKQRTLEALAHAVDVFGSINTRSILIVGLEPLESTLQGVRLLASMGVLPILCPFRPLAGTELENWPTPSPDSLVKVCLKAHQEAGRYGIPLGPICIPCQNNTLALPCGHPAYRCY